MTWKPNSESTGSPGLKVPVIVKFAVAAPPRTVKPSAATTWPKGVLPAFDSLRPMVNGELGVGEFRFAFSEALAVLTVTADTPF